MPKIYVCEPEQELVIRFSLLLVVPIQSNVTLLDFICAGYTQQVMMEALTEDKYHVSPVNATLLFTDCVRANMSGFIIIRASESTTEELTLLVNSMMTRLVARAKDTGYEMRHFKHEL